jgi:hypothetical protein
LVVDSVLAVLAVVNAVGALALSALFDVGFWNVAALWCALVVMLTSTVMFAAVSSGPSWGWREAVIEQVHGLCLVLLMVACLSALAVLESGALGVSFDGHPSDWLGLVERPAGVIAFAGGVRLIVRGRRRMRADSAPRA